MRPCTVSMSQAVQGKHCCTLNNMQEGGTHSRLQDRTPARENSAHIIKQLPTCRDCSPGPAGTSLQLLLQLPGPVAPAGAGSSLAATAGRHSAGLAVLTAVLLGWHPGPAGTRAVAQGAGVAGAAEQGTQQAQQTVETPRHGQHALERACNTAASMCKRWSTQECKWSVQGTRHRG